MEQLRAELERHGELPIGGAGNDPRDFFARAVDSLASAAEADEPSAEGDGGASRAARADLLLGSVPPLSPEDAADMALSGLLQEQRQTGGFFVGVPDGAAEGAAEPSAEAAPAWRRAAPTMTPGQSDLACGVAGDPGSGLRSSADEVAGLTAYRHAGADVDDDADEGGR
jgi:hypothetical protein